jgi:UDP-MurNAc hydroxylase
MDRRQQLLAIVVELSACARGVEPKSETRFHLPDAFTLGSLSRTVPEALSEESPLQQILSDYPNITFCLRSHSSANARRCMHVTDEPLVIEDDDSHYLSSFAWFMNRVKPKFAIPFASNSCYLHKDVLTMNAYSQTPLLVKHYFEKFAADNELHSELKMMIPGDEWASEHGFALREHDYYESRESRLRDYARQLQPTLEDYCLKEARTVSSLSMVERFFKDLWSRTPSVTQ